MSFTVLTTIEGFFSTFSFSGYLTSMQDSYASVHTRTVGVGLSNFPHATDILLPA
jgi:hypothetical protein